MKDEMISTAEAAELLGIHQASIPRMIKDGKLNGERIGRIWAVYKKSVIEYLERFGSLPKNDPRRGKTE